MATHSRTLAWRIPWTEEPGGLQSTGSQRVGHDLATKRGQGQEGLSFSTRWGPSSHISAELLPDPFLPVATRGRAAGPPAPGGVAGRLSAAPGLQVTPPPGQSFRWHLIQSG